MEVSILLDSEPIASVEEKGQMSATLTRVLACIASTLLLASCQTPGPANPAEGVELALIVQDVEATENLIALPTRITGRFRKSGDQVGIERQWPGTYVETEFSGSEVYFDVGEGEAALMISIDDMPPVTMVRPQPGRYQVSGFDDGVHDLRLDVVSESQAAPTQLGGIYTGPGSVKAQDPERKPQFEFIGDSHTVGYANTSTKRDCTSEEVWLTTNTALGVPGQLSALYGADYQVNAISGRGVVRNYNGGKDRTLIESYPYVLLNSTYPYEADDWNPDLILVAMGTNDFSTELNDSDPWGDRDDLISDYHATYAVFLKQLLARNKDAYFVVWMAGDLASEQSRESARVVESLHGAGVNRIGFVPITDLSFDACHAHPNVDDATIIANEIFRHLERRNLVFEGSSTE